MKRPVVDPLASPKDEPSNTTLSRIGPTVVVRRRVVDAPTTAKAHASDAFVEPEEDDSGPPSSVNVARALASLRADELTRLEQIMSDDEDASPAVAVATPAAAAVPTVKLGATISVTELARRLGVAPEELVTACVTNGFFSVTIKAVLPRETARTAATLFGFQTEDDDSDDGGAKHEKSSARATRPKKKTTKKG